MAWAEGRVQEGIGRPFHKDTCQQKLRKPEVFDPSHACFFSPVILQFTPYVIIKDTFLSFIFSFLPFPRKATCCPSSSPVLLSVPPQTQLLY